MRRTLAALLTGAALALCTASVTTSVTTPVAASDESMELVPGTEYTFEIPDAEWPVMCVYSDDGRKPCEHYSEPVFTATYNGPCTQKPEWSCFSRGSAAGMLPLHWLSK